MAAVLQALIIGIFLGALLRPFLDSYLRWTSARLYASLDVHEQAGDRSPDRERLP